jgi:hypothetical protein
MSCYPILDRGEEGTEFQTWLRRHDEYDAA